MLNFIHPVKSSVVPGSIQEQVEFNIPLGKGIWPYEHILQLYLQQRIWLHGYLISLTANPKPCCLNNPTHRIEFLSIPWCIDHNKLPRHVLLHPSAFCQRMSFSPSHFKHHFRVVWMQVHVHTPITVMYMTNFSSTGFVYRISTKYGQTFLFEAGQPDLQGMWMG